MLTYERILEVFADYIDSQPSVGVTCYEGAYYYLAFEPEFPTPVVARLVPTPKELLYCLGQDWRLDWTMTHFPEGSCTDDEEEKQELLAQQAYDEFLAEHGLG